MINFKQAFLADLTEVRGYTTEEAEKLYEEVGEDFIADIISDMWDNWSETFPIGEKDNGN